MIKGILLTLLMIATVGFSFFIGMNIDSLDDLKLLIDSPEEVEKVEVAQPKLNLGLNTAPNLEFVSATEYTKGDGNGSTIIKLIDWRGEKINTTCWETILFPNKTMYVDWTIMTQHWEFGNYYMNFPVPEPLGIYDQEVRCIVSNKNISIGKGFHVGNISNIVEDKADMLRVDRMSVMS